MQKVIRQWSDRKKGIEVPLFPNYIFVKLPDHQRSRVFYVNGVVKYIVSDGRPYRVSEDMIDSIRLMLLGGEPEVTNEQFIKGECLRVNAGPLCGLTGILVEKKGKYKLAICLDVMQKSMLVEVSASCLEKASPLQLN
jgi:transcription antitermination factor NusG